MKKVRVIHAETLSVLFIRIETVKCTWLYIANRYFAFSLGHLGINIWHQVSMKLIAFLAVTCMNVDVPIPSRGFTFGLRLSPSITAASSSRHSIYLQQSISRSPPLVSKRGCRQIRKAILSHHGGTHWQWVSAGFKPSLSKKSRNTKQLSLPEMSLPCRITDMFSRVTGQYFVLISVQPACFFLTACLPDTQSSQRRCTSLM